MKWKCPECNSLNAMSITRCACGYETTSEEMVPEEEHRLESTDDRKKSLELWVDISFTAILIIGVLVASTLYDISKVRQDNGVVKDYGEWGTVDRNRAYVYEDLYDKINIYFTPIPYNISAGIHLIVGADEKAMELCSYAINLKTNRAGTGFQERLQPSGAYIAFTACLDFFKVLILVSLLNILRKMILRRY
jgi:hypothetical protein